MNYSCQKYNGDKPVIADEIFPENIRHVTCKGSCDLADIRFENFLKNVPIVTIIRAANGFKYSNCNDDRSKYNGMFAAKELLFTGQC